MSNTRSDSSPQFVAEKASGIAQAKALREQAKNGGLRFEAYLPPELADWLLGAIERGGFMDPSEAVFVILGEHKELGPHADLRRELLQRRLQSSIDDPRPSIPAEEVFSELKKLLAAASGSGSVEVPQAHTRGQVIDCRRLTTGVGSRLLNTSMMWLSSRAQGRAGKGGRSLTYYSCLTQQLG